MGRLSETKMPPAWVIWVGSIFIIKHVFMALLAVFYVPSGPWVVPMGSATFRAPEFTISIVEAPTFARYYRLYSAATRCNDSFRFGSIRPSTREHSFEAQQLNQEGVVVSKFTYPESDVPYQVRYRQQRLAEQLDSDEELPPQTGIIVAPPGKTLPTLQWWQPDGERQFVLKSGDANAVPRNQSFMQPNFSQLLVAQSYVRFLTKKHGVSRMSLQRNWNDPILPMVLINDEPIPAELLRRIGWSYGELKP